MYARPTLPPSPPNIAAGASQRTWVYFFYVKQSWATTSMNRRTGMEMLASTQKHGDISPLGQKERGFLLRGKMQPALNKASPEYGWYS